jgi:hypothetical protein
MLDADTFEQDYSYTFASCLQEPQGEKAARLDLATSAPPNTQRLFFLGRLLRPELAANLMLATSDVAMHCYYTPLHEIERKLRTTDPVISASGSRLRCESFSRCCGVYARAEFLPEMLAPEVFVKGATNVDFNSDTRAGLARIRGGNSLQLRVEPDEIALLFDHASTLERKVKLPGRWLRGFAEVQSIGGSLQLAATLDSPKARRFLSELPTKVGAKDQVWLYDSAGGVRLSQRPDKDAIAAAGLGRLAVLKPLGKYARALRIYAGAYGSSAFELDFETARFFLILSGAPARGFSGEGQLLMALTTNEAAAAADRIESRLRYDDEFQSDVLAGRLKLAEPLVKDALSTLAVNGIIGFDPHDRVYFHRELPFDRDILRASHPRLESARKLVATGAVVVDQLEENRIVSRVQSEDVEHRVKVDGPEFNCTCLWHSRTGGASGPCKHVLASLIAGRDAM